MSSNITTIKIAVCQSDTIWHDVKTNLDSAKLWIEQTDADLFVFPEMFATGFSMQPERIAQTMDGLIVTQLRKIAADNNKAIITSVAIELDPLQGSLRREGYVNRLLFISPEGDCLSYDKRHTFRMSGEHEHYLSGDRRLVVHYRGFRICPLVCYDLRFPVWSRNKGDYDVLIYVASWPEARRHPWRTLLPARAIENQAFCVGVNRVGNDPRNSYSGDSVVLDFRGEVMTKAAEHTAEVVVVDLCLEDLEQYRKEFPVWMDADEFELIV